MGSSQNESSIEYVSVLLDHHLLLRNTISHSRTISHEHGGQYSEYLILRARVQPMQIVNTDTTMVGPMLRLAKIEYSRLRTTYGRVIIHTHTHTTSDQNMQAPISYLQSQHTIYINQIYMPLANMKK